MCCPSNFVLQRAGFTSSPIAQRRVAARRAARAVHPLVRQAVEEAFAGCIVKQAPGLKVPVRTRAGLRAAADEHTNFIAANRDRVGSHSQDSAVKYAV